MSEELQIEEEKFFAAIIDAMLFLNYRNGVRIDISEDMLHQTVSHAVWQYDETFADYRRRLTEGKKEDFNN